MCVCEGLNKSHAIRKFTQICSFTSVSSVFCDSVLAASSQLALGSFYDAWRRLNELLFIVGPYVKVSLCVCVNERACVGDKFAFLPLRYCLLYRLVCLHRVCVCVYLPSMPFDEDDGQGITTGRQTS